MRSITPGGIPPTTAQSARLVLRRSEFGVRAVVFSAQSRQVVVPSPKLQAVRSLGGEAGVKLLLSRPESALLSLCSAAAATRQ